MALLADERLQQLLRLRTRGVLLMDWHLRWTGGTGGRQRRGSEEDGNKGDEQIEGVKGNKGEGNKGDDGNFPEGGGR